MKRDYFQKYTKEVKCAKCGTIQNVTHKECIGCFLLEGVKKYNENIRRNKRKDK